MPLSPEQERRVQDTTTNSRWHKSSYSGSSGGECVEVSEGRQVLVRDTEHRDLTNLVFQSTEWTSLLKSLKH